MRNKGVVVVLTIIVTALCLYYLSFTFVSRKVEQDAIAYATNSSGSVDLSKKQSYMDSLWSKPVYNLFGAEYTFKEVKENELSLGLDLQGGMHVTLEVSPIDIIKGLSGNNQDPAFMDALHKASEMQRSSQERYSALFFRAYKEANPGQNLAHLFASAANKDRVSLSDDDAKVMAFVNAEIESAIDRSFTILKTRIDQFGTSQPNIQKLQGTGRIQIEIPGADNPARVRKLLQGVARLEFWDVVEYNDEQLNQSLFAINQKLVKEQEANKALKPLEAANEVQDTLVEEGDSTKSQLEKQLNQAQDSASNPLDSITNSNLSPLFALSSPGIPFLYDVKDTATINRILARPDIRALLPRNISYRWDVKPEPEVTPNVDDIRLNFISVPRNGKPLLTGEVINDARLDYDQFARPAVSMTMNAAGSRAWAKITAAAAAKSPPGRVAIVLDNYVYTAPTVQGEIPNGNSQITGSFTLEEAKDLANVLKAGSLPAPTRIVEEAIIGPTLGKVAQNQGIISMACGLVIVALFMVAYYSRGGWVADLALLFNIFFILGILAQLNAALTLPGIAGIVLTMGMAVDANVLIYERIKEELKSGLMLKEAIKKGYSRAFDAIFDSNVTTLLTGIFLFVFGQGPLKGFAIVLMIGIATSFFSAVYISRVVIEWMTRKGDASKVSFDSFMARGVRERRYFNFVGYRRIAYTITGSITILGFILIGINGLNLGVDFKGGRSYVVAFDAPVVATDMRIKLTDEFEGSGTEVKTYGSSNVVRVTTSYLVDDESSEADVKVKAALIDGVEKFSGKQFVENNDAVDKGHFSILSSSKVGATIADDIKDSAFEASLYSLIAIFIFILIRFKKWQYSLGAILSTAHDALFVVAVFGIADTFGFSLEIDQVFIAALLSVIGYSINDTVIIFDRIREYTHLGTSHDRLKVFNDAINSTLSRTLITSGTTLIVVVVLLLFGGEVLRGFSFALFVGIMVGTFSSIFIAASVVYDLDKRKERKQVATGVA
ncbi:MAG: protein translocase subunit SecDF [Cyclobacteriaceae bacterium]|nr:protein translocase subunit SecDF [Cyclobacteriaceae bacterium]MCB0498963.1 protein translocase subunit SecDF [Cyclobacteriaceae bacterium]MCB9238239.1 protein translocase subunit SecDF [Flammeovirgaceae bacterium]MCO5272164.1 protein translocase subunit SecDF [Cyclobacteriaceae bacterium]MCW5902721.1 protein translocase subunit SecDF [Cyclobacteriaceae bacterium]